METVEIKTLLDEVGDVDLDSKRSFRVKTFYPVVYSGTSGGGPNEYAASNDPNVANQHRIKVGRKVLAAFYQPHHNIGALGDFAWLDVVPDKRDVILQAAAYEGRNSRIRLKVTVLTK